jgi:putative FmdB family regulatory protein
MPIYEYGCQQCGCDFEEMQKFSDPPIESCPECGSLEAKRKVSVSAFHLKGGGWYKDGYGVKAEDDAKSKTDDSGKKEAKKEDSKKETKSESNSNKESKKASDPKEKPSKKAAAA